jgi:muramoyltetrapeptide carboxypeptidase LdcA involved in peptidoglycan recycling
VQGRLIGGCIEVLNFIRGTEIFPSVDDFKDSILFFETSEEKPPSWLIECELRNYGISGILDGVLGIICGKPQDEYLMNEYNETIVKVLKEFGREDMPVITNMNFGHTEPKICLPYGALAEINCDLKTFKILESGVVED